VNKTELIALAKKAAEAAGIFAAIVCAICERESSWNHYALRYETAFFGKYVAPQYAAGKIDITEAQARAFSWGLMQVMGEEAREFGFVGSIAGLCHPETGLAIGCRIFAHKLAVNHGDVAAALQAWNGGGNPNYAREVLALADKYK
jgi:soluble lytic murein transglycosylase-like protein